MLASDVFLLDQAMQQRFLTCLQILTYVWIVQLRNPKQISCSIFYRKKWLCSAKDLLVLSSACLPVNLVANISLRVYFLLFQPSEAWLCTSQVSLRNLHVTTTASRWPRSSFFLVIKQRQWLEMLSGLSQSRSMLQLVCGLPVKGAILAKRI